MKNSRNELSTESKDLYSKKCRSTIQRILLNLGKEKITPLRPTPERKWSRSRWPPANPGSTPRSECATRVHAIHATLYELLADRHRCSRGDKPTPRFRREDFPPSNEASARSVSRWRRWPRSHPGLIFRPAVLLREIAWPGSATHRPLSSASIGWGRQPAASPGFAQTDCVSPSRRSSPPPARADEARAGKGGCAYASRRVSPRCRPLPVCGSLAV